MSQERFFRLLSIALLGLMGLAFLPETRPETRPDSKTEPVAVETVNTSKADVEVQASLEVNEINAGRFKPYMLGEDSVEVSELDLMPSTSRLVR